MKRREFLIAIGGAVAALPSAARAEQDGAIRRIGVLMPFSPEDPKVKTDLAAFARQLQSLGWIQGQNMQIDYRWSSLSRRARTFCLPEALRPPPPY